MAGMHWLQFQACNHKFNSLLRTLTYPSEKHAYPNVKQMLGGIREKLSPSCQQLKVEWFTNDSFIMKTHTILIAYNHYKRM
jgi:hypothetical protein